MERALRIGTVLTIALGLSGCADKPRMPSPTAGTPQEDLVDVDLGAFRVPVPGNADDPKDENLADRHGLTLRFQLWASVPAGRENDVAQRLALHDARLREEIIFACRLATVDELAEPALASFKGQVATVLGKYLGPRLVRRVILTSVRLEPT
jgi:hypothetical protein